LALHDVRPVDARGLDADQYFIVAGLGDRPDRRLQLFRSAGRCDLNHRHLTRQVHSISPRIGKSQKGAANLDAPEYLGKIPWICGKMLACSSGNLIIW
jgi:hypothetical protein